MSRPATSPRRRTSSARRDPASTGIHRQGARNTVPGALSCARAVTPGGPGRRMSRCRTPTEWLLPPDGRTAARFGRRSVPGLMRGRGPSPTREPPGGSGSLVDPGAAGGGTRLRDVRGGTGDLRTVAGRQMAVTAARHLYRGRCLAHVPVRGLPAAGTADRTALVYRWRGLPYRSSRSAISTIRPRCITAARCEGWRTMARSGRLRLQGRRAGHPDAAGADRRRTREGSGCHVPDRAPRSPGVGWTRSNTCAASSGRTALSRNGANGSDRASVSDPWCVSFVVRGHPAVPVTGYHGRPSC